MNFSYLLDQLIWVQPGIYARWKCKDRFWKPPLWSGLSSNAKHLCHLPLRLLCPKPQPWCARQTKAHENQLFSYTASNRCQRKNFKSWKMIFCLLLFLGFAPKKMILSAWRASIPVLLVPGSLALHDANLTDCKIIHGAAPRLILTQLTFFLLRL